MNRGDGDTMLRLREITKDWRNVLMLGNLQPETQARIASEAGLDLDEVAHLLVGCSRTDHIASANFQFIPGQALPVGGSR